MKQEVNRVLKACGTHHMYHADPRRREKREGNRKNISENNIRKWKFDEKHYLHIQEPS